MYQTLEFWLLKQENFKKEKHKQNESAVHLPQFTVITITPLWSNLVHPNGPRGKSLVYTFFTLLKVSVHSYFQRLLETLTSLKVDRQTENILDGELHRRIKDWNLIYSASPARLQRVVGYSSSARLRWLHIGLFTQGTHTVSLMSRRDHTWRPNTRVCALLHIDYLHKKLLWS